MTTNLTLSPNHPLRRAQQLTEQARAFAARGQRDNAERCRRRAFAWLQFAALAADDQPAPNQWILEQLLAAHLACAGQDANVAAGAPAH